MPGIRMVCGEQWVRTIAVIVAMSAVGCSTAFSRQNNPDTLRNVPSTDVDNIFSFDYFPNEDDVSNMKNQVISKIELPSFIVGDFPENWKQRTTQPMLPQQSGSQHKNKLREVLASNIVRSPTPQNVRTEDNSKSIVRDENKSLTELDPKFSNYMTFMNRQSNKFPTATSSPLAYTKAQRSLNSFNKTVILINVLEAIKPILTDTFTSNDYTQAEIFDILENPTKLQELLLKKSTPEHTLGLLAVFRKYDGSSLTDILKNISQNEPALMAEYLNSLDSEVRHGLQRAWTETYTDPEQKVTHRVEEQVEIQKKRVVQDKVQKDEDYDYETASSNLHLRFIPNPTALFNLSVRIIVQ